MHSCLYLWYLWDYIYIYEYIHDMIWYIYIYIFVSYAEARCHGHAYRRLRWGDSTKKNVSKQQHHRTNWKIFMPWLWAVFGRGTPFMLIDGPRLYIAQRVRIGGWGWGWRVEGAGRWCRLCRLTHRRLIMWVLLSRSLVFMFTMVTTAVTNFK